MGNVLERQEWGWGGEEDSPPELRNPQDSRQLLSKEGDPEQVPSRSTVVYEIKGVQNRSCSF